MNGVHNKVYLAGAITGLNFADSTDWRDDAKAKLAGGGRLVCTEDTDGDGDCPGCAPGSFLGKNSPCRTWEHGPLTGIVGYSPMRAKDYLAAVGVLSGKPDAYADYVLSSAKGITTRDSWDVATCDLMLINLLGAEKISIGTVLEVGMGYAQKKPMVVAMEDDNPHHHVMLDTMVGWIVDDLDYAIDITKAILLPDGVKVAA